MSLKYVVLNILKLSLLSKYFKILGFLMPIFISTSLQAENQKISLSFYSDKPIVKNIQAELTINILDNNGERINVDTSKNIVFDNKNYKLDFINGTAKLNYVFIESKNYKLLYNDADYEKFVNPIPIILTVLPPLVAILFALLFKEVFSALLIGILSGTFIIYFYQGLSVFSAFWKALFAIFDTYIINALTEPSHMSIIIFSLMIAATVHIISKNGGMQGIINYLSKYAKDSVSGQIVTWFLGICIFFDDYANTLVVGNTMRPVTDKLKISREKLAYIVDSTAAPIASIAFITTWIGAELSYIQSAIENIDINANAYSIFFSSLQFAFYPILALSFVIMLILSKREFGPMYKAEMKCQLSEKNNIANPNSDSSDTLLSSVKNPKAYNAIIPILVIVFGAIAGLIYTGFDSNVWNDSSLSFFSRLSYIIGNSDSYLALIWSSMGGLFSAILLSLVQRILSLQKAMDYMIDGFKTMLSAVIILCLAWTLAEIIKDLNTAIFITGFIKSVNISIYFLPVVTFIISALVAFSTGSSWGTMAIMYPLILPATWLLANETGLNEIDSYNAFAHVVSTVIAGSVLGDHCSPISDTTILSSLACSCNHIKHVKTQMPYALTVGLVAILFGTIPAAFGLNIMICFIISFCGLYLAIRVFGKKLNNNLV